MKKLKSFEEEIYKCSKCGLCQSVCPVYKVTGNDCAVSRGKFIMLKGVLRGDLELNKNVVKYLDMCTKCGKCKDFCPSGIDAVEIFTSAKSEYLNKSAVGTLTKLVQKGLALGLSIPKQRLKTSKKAKVAYFKGCTNNVYPKCIRATEILLEKMGVEVLPIEFECCGMPFLSSGNLEQFEIQKKKNLAKLTDEVEWILTDCASCEWTLSKYGNDVKNKLKNIYEFIAESDLEFVFKKGTSFTFHKPCHLENIDFLPKILTKCKNLEYIEMEDFDECCGFAGEFALKNHKISKKLTDKKVKNAKKTGAKYITTACPSCQMGLLQSGAKSINLVELLAFRGLEG